MRMIRLLSIDKQLVNSSTCLLTAYQGYAKLKLLNRKSKKYFVI